MPTVPEGAPSAPLTDSQPPATRRLQDAAVVLGVPVTFGLLVTLLRGPAASLAFTTTRLTQTLASELGLGALLYLYVRRRGYGLMAWTVPFEPRDLLRGVPVWVYGLVASLIGWLLAWALSPEIAARLGNAGFSGLPSAWIIGLASPINATFEEYIWLGFAVTVAGRRRYWPALAWSVLPRTLIHVYQGWNSVFFVAPLGIWFFRYYWRTGRLWPVIVAHTLQDIVALGLLALRHAR